MNLCNTFKTKITSREEWAAYSVMWDYVISIFTVGLKTEGTNSGVSYDDLDISVSLMLPTREEWAAYSIMWVYAISMYLKMDQRQVQIYFLTI